MHVIISIIIGILFLIDSILLFAFAGFGMTEFVQNSPLASAIFILVQLPIIYFILYKAYIYPVQVLNQSIAKFMTGIDEEINIEITSWSK